MSEKSGKGRSKKARQEPGTIKEEIPKIIPPNWDRRHRFLESGAVWRLPDGRTWKPGDPKLSPEEIKKSFAAQNQPKTRKKDAARAIPTDMERAEKFRSRGPVILPNGTIWRRGDPKIPAKKK